MMMNWIELMIERLRPPNSERKSVRYLRYQILLGMTSCYDFHISISAYHGMY